MRASTRRNNKYRRPLSDIHCCDGGMEMRKIAVICAAALLISALLLSACGRTEQLPVVPTLGEMQRMLVIDPGHGGEDGGAQGENGLLESDINLEIALRMEALARFCGVPVCMTRSTREIDYPPELQKTAERKLWDQKQRVAFLHEKSPAVLVSIHQNKYPHHGPFGPQVLYAEGEDSKGLGELMHGLLTQKLCPENRRVAAPIAKEIYLTRMADCPAVLVECGFLSNPAEAEKLASPDYQIKLACTLLCAYTQYFSASKGT